MADTPIIFVKRTLAQLRAEQAAKAERKLQREIDEMLKMAREARARLKARRAEAEREKS